MGKKAVIVGLGCVGALGLVAAVGALFGYLYWTSPTYSLRQVRKAVDERDLASFERYVDIHGICNSGVDRFIEKTSSGGGDLGRALGAGIAMVVKPAMVDAIQKEIRTAIVEGRVLTEDHRVELNIDEVVTDSRGALVWLIVPGRDFDPPRQADAHVQIRMRNMGTYWQAYEIAALEGFEEAGSGNGRESAKRRDSGDGDDNRNGDDNNNNNNNDNGNSNGNGRKESR
jgi:hypothetical protein